MRVTLWMFWAGLSIYAVAAPTVLWSLESSWHDQQRIGQIGLFVLASVTLAHHAFSKRMVVAPLHLMAMPGALLTALFALAGLSASLSDHPQWAWMEVAVAAGCAGVAWAVAEGRRRTGATADVGMLAVTLLLTAAISVASLAGYVALFLAGGFRGAEELLSGFENPRFFGHALVPVLILLGAAPFHGRFPRSVRWSGLLLMVWAWAMLWMSGARGAWIAAVAAFVVAALFGSMGRRLAGLQFVSAIGGGLVYHGLMTWLPALVGADVQGEISERLDLLATGHLSRRELLWRQAIDMGLAQPWLGAGPMHFAALEETVAAHPHNLVLQWFAELGLPSLALFMGLMVWASIKGIVGVCRLQQGDQRLLAITLMSALAGIVTNSMTDGLHVMPYTQTCIAVLAGWLIGIQSSREPEWKGSTLVMALSPLVAMVAFLVIVAAKDIPHLRGREEAFLEATSDRLQPRFWRQGRIQW